MLVSNRHCFNPRPPRGGRLARWDAELRLYEFQSTPPTRGATAPRHPIDLDMTRFNPRPPRGGRQPCVDKNPPLSGFNPRPPRGGRHPRLRPIARICAVSIHAPHAGGDIRCHSDAGRSAVSIHAPHAGGDVPGQSCHAPFQSTPPTRGATVCPLGTAELRIHRVASFNPRPPRGGRQMHRG